MLALDMTKNALLFESHPAIMGAELLEHPDDDPSKTEGGCVVLHTNGEWFGRHHRRQQALLSKIKVTLNKSGTYNGLAS